MRLAEPTRSLANYSSNSNMRWWLDQVVTVVAILVVLVPAVSLALAVLALLTLTYATAAILFGIAISARVLGNRLLGYLERKLRGIT